MHIEGQLEQATQVEELRFYLDPRHEGAVAFAAARRLEPNPADTYTEMHASRRNNPACVAGRLYAAFYRDINHLPTLVEALNRGFEGFYGHHGTTETDFAPHLAELDPDGLLLLFALGGSVAGTVSAELAPDLTERSGVPTGRVGSPGVVSEYRLPKLYGALLLSGVAYLKQQNAVRSELQSWGDAPETITLYTTLGFAVHHQQIAYGRPVR